MRRLTALLMLLTAALLLTACAAPHLTPALTATRTATLRPTATPQPPTATPTATFTPSPTPLPAGLGDLLGQLHTVWATNATYTPATPEQVAQLAKDLGVEPAKLGQVYRVKAENGAVFWASEETGQTYAERQVPAYWKYENGEKVDVPAHEEAVTVEEAINDPVEFSHWGDGQVVKVKYEDGGEGWLYLNEQGKWAKIYESGFDPELWGDWERHFKEVTGKTIEEWIDGVNMHNLYQSKIDLESVYKYDKAWQQNRYIGIFGGIERVHTEKWGNFIVMNLVYPMYDKNDGHNKVVYVPLVIAKEKDNGDVVDLSSRMALVNHGNVLVGGFQFDGGVLDFERDDIWKVFSDDNFGKRINVWIIDFIDLQKILDNNGFAWGSDLENKLHTNLKLNEQLIEFYRNNADYAKWFAGLPIEVQQKLVEKIGGRLPVAVSESDSTVQEVLSQYPIKEGDRIVGFFVGIGGDLENKNFGSWIVPQK